MSYEATDYDMLPTGKIIRQITFSKAKNYDMNELIELNRVCFPHADYQNLTKIFYDPENFGEIYKLWSHREHMIIGYSVYGQFNDGNWDNNAYILRIGTHEKFRRMGYAGWMIDHIIYDMKSRGNCDGIYADISPNNENSINLCQSKGFKCIGERENFYGNACNSKIYCYYIGGDK